MGAHPIKLIEAIVAGYGIKSARVLGEEHGLTRNAVIGIWNRHLHKRPRHKAKKPQVLPPVDAPVSLDLPFAELTRHHCRYPTRSDGRQHRFCGAPVDQSIPVPYCAYHFRVAYRVEVAA